MSYNWKVSSGQTMECNAREPRSNKHRSYFVMKVLLFVLCVTNVVLLAVVAKGFFTLKDLNSRLNVLEKEQILIKIEKLGGR